MFFPIWKTFSHSSSTEKNEWVASRSYDAAVHFCAWKEHFPYKRVPWANRKGPLLLQLSLNSWKGLCQWLLPSTRHGYLLTGLLTREGNARYKKINTNWHYRWSCLWSNYQHMISSQRSLHPFRTLCFLSKLVLKPNILIFVYIVKVVYI